MQAPTRSDERVLPAIADGSCVISTAILECDGSFGPEGIACTAQRSGDAYVLTGTKLLVGYASSADFFLCVARTGSGPGADGLSLFLVDAGAPGISSTPMTNIAGNALHTVTFDAVSTPADSIVGALDDGWAPLSRATTKAAVLQTATIVGAAPRRPRDDEPVPRRIASSSGIRSGVTRPSSTWCPTSWSTCTVRISWRDRRRSESTPGKPYFREAAIAVAFGKKASAHLHRQAHEVHAGVAFIVDHDLTLFSSRAKFWEYNLGDARHYQELFGARVEYLISLAAAQ